MSKYGTLANLVSTPQSEPVLGRKDMVANSAGGYVFQLDMWGYLRRFLILGSESPSYYASARQLTRANAENLIKCIETDGSRTVQTIVEVSKQGIAPKNDPAIFALALCAKMGNEGTRQAALRALPEVCRIGTHLFSFLSDMEGVGGWGRATKRAVSAWYRRDPQEVVYQVTKYASRGSWTHRDALRLAKPKPNSNAERTLFRYIAKGELPPTEAGNEETAWIAYAGAVAEMANCKSEKKAAALIRDHRLPREVVPTELLTKAEVWEALLEHMPYTALIRNLATMTRIGLIAPFSDGTARAVAMLANGDALQKARIHPIAVLTALKQYAAGHGNKSSATWTPVSAITDALNDAFYASVRHVEPTNKKWLLGLDVSGSMDMYNGAGISGLTPRVVCGALAMITAQTEKQYEVRAFSDKLIDCNISPRMRLDTVLDIMDHIPMGGTDCSLPIVWATENKVPVDVFAVYTDNETWSGRIHPFQALEKYQRKMGINAHLIVMGIVSNNFTIADPRNPRMLDVVGCDSSAPAIMADFVRGSI